MKTLVSLLCAAAISVAGASAGFAQNSSNASHCNSKDGNCLKTQQKTTSQKANQKSQTSSSKAPVKKSTSKKSTEKSNSAPHVGQSARNSQPFQRAKNSRYSNPPKGQEYRVVNNHVVLVNEKTLAIVSVLGLVSALSN